MEDSQLSSDQWVTFASVGLDGKVIFEAVKDDGNGLSHLPRDGVDTSSCTPSVEDDGLDSDGYKCSGEKNIKKKFIYNGKQCVILDVTDLQFKAKPCPDSGSVFLIQTYEDTRVRPWDGIAVALSVESGGTRHTVCCSSDGSVRTTTDPLPHVIQDNQHEAIFHLRRYSKRGFKLKSSKCPDHYLGLKSLSSSVLTLVHCKEEIKDDERVLFDLKSAEQG